MGPIAIYFDGKRVLKALKEGTNSQEQITLLGYPGIDDPNPDYKYYAYSLPADQFRKFSNNVRYSNLLGGNSNEIFIQEGTKSRPNL